MNDYFDEQEVDDLERIAELSLKKGDKKTALLALRKIDAIVEDVRKKVSVKSKITPEIEAKYPYPEKPKSQPQSAGFGQYAGMGQLLEYTALANWETEKRRIDKLRELAATNPEQADIISSMSPSERLLTGMGAGLTDIYRAASNLDQAITPEGWPIAPLPMPSEASGMQELEAVSPLATGGRVVGQALPFLPAGLAAGSLPTMGGRTLGGALVGGTEGAAIASGTGGDVSTGALVGAAVGGSAEVVGTAFNRIASPLVRKWFGESAKAVDETGAPTPELIYAAQKEGVTVDDLIKQAEDPRAFTREAIKSGQIGAYEDIAQGVQVDPTKMAALKTLGINPEQAPVAALTNQQKIQELAGAVAANPASVASEELTNYSKLLSQKADELIVQMGGEIDKAEANQSIKSGLEGLISETKAAESELYKRINDQVGNPIVNTKLLLADILKSASKSSQGVKGLSEVERKVYQKLQGKPTYFDIDNLRREIGAAIGGDTDAFKNSTSAKLDEMYAKLTQLQEGVANQVGGAAGLWKEAKDLGLKRFELQDSARLAFNKDLGGSLIPKVERALTQAGKADVANLKKVMDKLPKHLQERAMATALNGVFTSSRGVDRGFTATNLAAFGENLKRSPTAQNLLKSYLPEGGYDRLQAMIELSNGLANVQRKITRTGIVPEELKNFQNTGKIVGALYKTAQVMDAVPLGGTISRPARLAGTAVQASEPDRLANIDIADNLLTSNQFKAAAMAHAEGDAKKIAYLDAALKKTPAYKKYIKSIPKSNAATIASVGLIPFLVQQEESQ